VAKPQPSFEQLLSGGARNGAGERDEAVRQAIKTPARLPELFDCIHSTDPRVALRAASAFDKATQDHPQRARPFHDRIVLAAGEHLQADVRWHILHLFGRLEFHADERPAVMALLTRAIDEETSKIAATNALQAIVELAERYEDLHEEARRITAIALEHPAPSVRARARKLERTRLKQL
jgi:hypothetical protein